MCTCQGGGDELQTQTGTVQWCPQLMGNVPHERSLVVHQGGEVIDCFVLDDGIVQKQS